MPLRAGSTWYVKFSTWPQPKHISQPEALKVINFLAKHGLNPVFMNNSQKFDKAWLDFLIAGEELPAEWPQKLVDISIM